MKKKENKKYNGLGFVEALIALTVSGIVGIVLMSISASALNELRTLDTRDEIEFHAVSTAVHLQRLAIEQAVEDPENNPFFNLLEGNCYGFKNKEEGEAIDVTSSVDPNIRETFTTSPIEGTDYFRIFCVESANNRKVLLRVIVGSTRMEGRVTSKGDIKDYEYLAIINLR